MLIQNLTNACIVIKGEKEKIIIDPWFEDGIYLGTWHNFPRVSEKKLINSLKDVGFCLITHLHKDHFNIETIKKYLKKSTQFILPKVFGYQVMLNTLKNNGFNHVEILDCGVTLFETNEFSIRSIEPLNTSGLIDITKNELSIDAGFSVYSKKHNKKLIFLADNNLYDVDKVKKNIDLLDSPDLIAFSYSGFASDYPFNYKFSDEEMVEICNSLEEIRFNKQIKCLHLIKPKNILVYSSEFIPVHEHSKKWMEIFPRIWTSNKFSVAERYAVASLATGYAMYPDDSLEINNNGDFVPNINEIDNIELYREMIEYADSIKLDNYYNQFSDDNISADEIIDLLKKASLNYKNALIRNNLSPSQVLNFMSDDIYLGSISIDGEFFNHGSAEIDSKSLYIDCELFILKKILLNQEHWNDASLSMRISWDRIPNVYCSDTFNALNYLRN